MSPSIHTLCLVLAEDYDDSSDISIEKMLTDRAIISDNAQGQGRRQGEGHAKIERPIRAHFGRSRVMPNYHRLQFDYDRLAA